VSRLRADFSPEELSAVLARYNVGAVTEIDEQRKGSRRSPKVVVTTPKGKFLLKRRARGRDYPIRVMFAHKVQQYLSEKNFPLPRLMKLQGDDDTMVIRNGLIYELFEFVTGQHYDRSPEQTWDAGRVLGLFHRYLSSYEREWDPPSRSYHDAEVVRSHLNAVPASVGKDDSVAGKESELLTTVTTLYEAYALAADQINEAGYDEWAMQIVHSDWHPGNMLFDQQRVRAVIDYDSLHLLPPITDVANGVLQFSILGGPVDPRQWPAELDEDRARRFIAGYEDGFEISGEQLRMLPALMIEALIAEAVAPIAATGSFGRLEGFRFLKMICRKVGWLQQNGPQLVTSLQASSSS
jgi:homoserine kinase type II